MSRMEGPRRATPDVTWGNVLGRGVRAVAEDVLVPMGESVVAQTAALAADHIVFGESPSIGQSLDRVVSSDGQPLEVYLPFALGAYLGERTKVAKERIGIAPKNPDLAFWWRRAVEVQTASYGLALAKSVQTFERVMTVMQHPDFFLGAGMTFVGGSLALVDNIALHAERRSLEHMTVPTAAMAMGVAGFLMSPVEIKPQMAGFAVAAIANFVENAAEVVDTGEFGTSLQKISEGWRDRARRAVESAQTLGRSAGDIWNSLVSGKKGKN